MTPSQAQRSRRREQFRKLGAALSNLERDWAIRKVDVQYDPRPVPLEDPDLTSKFGGPAMCTIQYPSTVYADIAEQ